MAISAYPLQWPAGWKRTLSGWRKSGNFSTRRRTQTGYFSAQQLTIDDGVERVLNELARMGFDRNDTVISTNVQTRLDGLPRSDRSEPIDPGVAVYWQQPNGENKVMAIDLYDRVADNLAAIAATLDAMRAIERHGGATILERAFTGFTALPAPAGGTWWSILGVDEHASQDTIKSAYRKLASEHHPDRGGDSTRMAEINDAYRSAMQVGPA